MSSTTENKIKEITKLVDSAHMIPETEIEAVLSAIQALKKATASTEGALKERLVRDKVTIHSMTYAASFKSNTFLYFIEYRKDNVEKLKKASPGGSAIWITKAQFNAIMESVSDKILFKSEGYSDDSGATNETRIINKATLHDELAEFIEREKVFNRSFSGLSDH